MAFEGFTRDTLAFLGDLSAHNDRSWFNANKARYERELLDREKRFIAAMGHGLHSLRPHVEAIPRVNGSIFRINRDTRFSHDKTPYKTYTDLWFWEGSERKLSPGFFISITPTTITTGAGTYMTSSERVDRLRRAVDARGAGERVVEILGDLAAAGYEIGEPGYKRVPRGFAPDHPRAELLKYRVLHASRREDVPAEFYGPRFIDWCMNRFERVLPLHEWLVDVFR